MVYEYAILRVVPRPERGEYINAGVVLFCPEASFLDAAIHMDEDRLLALDARVDSRLAREHLESARRVCAGGPAAGELGPLPPRERFGRIVAPRSTIIQPSPVHTGLTEEPRQALTRLLESHVLT